MESCYNNLALAEQSTSKSDQDTISPFSLESRLRIEVSRDQQILLRDLFTKRELSSGRVVIPRRVLIQGRAGVGKTTLCKKIVHDYVHHGMWANSFDRLLWIPLRRLKGKSGTYNLATFLHGEYFAHEAQDKGFSEAMWERLSDQSFEQRTLFLLDGLDEVSQDWSPETPVYRFLQELLAQPNAILTSRPQGLSERVGHFDLQLETIGFSPTEVNEYLNHSIDNEDTVKNIQRFLQDRPLIQGLVRIPIQLDALCFSWEAGDFQSGDKPSTMTTLYQSISRELWKKDIRLLEKEYQGKHLADQEVQRLERFEVEDIVRLEERFLEGYAFQAL
ncbi:hypothetical protein MMC25_005079 [Agyrium rufum]|nr:hypothetical protein [Agyrium rufum]